MQEPLLDHGIGHEIDCYSVASPQSPSFNVGSVAQFLCDDVLYNIFLLELPSNVAIYPEGSFILNVSQVCRAWRSVTETNKNLWAEIMWDPLEGDELSMEVSHQEWATLVFQEYLSRSGDCPLSISIQSSSPATPSFTSFEKIVTKTLSMPIQRRLRNLSLHCAATDLCPTSGYMVINAPLLEKLDIDIAESNAFGGELYVDICQSPHLRSLMLTGEVRLSTSYMRAASLPSLETMVLRTSSKAGNWWIQADTLLHLLLQFPSLGMINIEIQVKTSISLLGDVRKHSHSKTRAGHLVTMYLRLTQDPVITANELLKVLELPKIKTLTLDYNFSPGNFFYLLHTWSDVACLESLEELTVCYGSMAEDHSRDKEIVSLLRSTPSLVHLTIRDVPLSGSMFEALGLITDSTAQSASRSLCSKLELISIENKNPNLGDPYLVPPSALIRTLNDRHQILVVLPSNDSTRPMNGSS